MNLIGYGGVPGTCGARAVPSVNLATAGEQMPNPTFDDHVNHEVLERNGESDLAECKQPRISREPTRHDMSAEDAPGGASLLDRSEQWRRAL